MSYTNMSVGYTLVGEVTKFLFIIIRYNGWLDAITKTWTSEGVRGLFKGSVPRIIWYVPASAFTFMAVEFLRDHFNDKDDADAHEVTSLSIDTKSEVEKSA
jgi:hypothetical protein